MNVEKPVEPVVADVMTRDMFAVAPDTSLETAARLLATHHIHGLPVVDGVRPLGLVTLTDLADPDRNQSDSNGYPLFYRIKDGTLTEIGDDAVIRAGCVSDVMSPFVLSIESTASLVEAARRMIADDVHRLLVMEENELIGIVSAVDLLRGFVQRADRRNG